jgi:prepilin-type N-terminal cleavage/methylation domain-containing protein
LRRDGLARIPSKKNQRIFRTAASDRLKRIRERMIGLKSRHKFSGHSLLELLCVILIIAILAALYFGAISKAFAHVKKFLGG